MGQSAFQIFAQQAGQVGQILATSPTGLGGLMKQLGGSVAGMLTPTRLLGASLVGLGVGGYAAFQSWKNFALTLDDVAKQAGETSSKMAQLQAVASFKGIDAEEFAKGVGTFSQQIYLAKQNMGGLVEVLRANGVSAAGNFTTIFGKAADLIKNASGEQQRLVLLQQMGLPATMDWVRLMSQGSDGIKKASDEAAKFGGVANDEMVKKAREADQEWNKFWTNFSQGAKQATVSGVAAVAGVMQKIRQAQVDARRGTIFTPLSGGSQLRQSAADEFYRATNASSAVKNRNTLDKDSILRDIALAQTRLGPLGQTPTAKEQVGSEQQPQRKAA
jgi:hypothetical protein